MDDMWTAQTFVTAKVESHWRVGRDTTLLASAVSCTVSNRQLQKPRRRCQAFAPPGQDQLQMAMDPTAPRVKVRVTLATLDVVLVIVGDY